MRIFLTLAAVLAPMAASAQSTPYSSPSPYAPSPYAMNTMRPAAGAPTLDREATSVNSGQQIYRSGSQFTPSGTSQLYGNYGSDYNPTLPNNVYGQDTVRSVPDERVTPQTEASQ